MFTSRAEHRLILRQDNADKRIMKYGNENGLINSITFKNMEGKYNKIHEVINDLKERTITIDSEALKVIEREDRPLNIKGKINVGKLLKRPEVKLADILKYYNEELEENLAAIVEMEIKYEGYIKRDLDRIKKISGMEEKLIPVDFDYDNINGVKKEAIEKLKDVRPGTLGQAMRISGVDPSVISILSILIESKNRGKKDVPRGT